MHNVQLNAQIVIDVLQRKLNEVEQRATEIEVLFLMEQNENKMLHEKIEALKGGENVDEIKTAE